MACAHNHAKLRSFRNLDGQLGIYSISKENLYQVHQWRQILFLASHCDAGAEEFHLCDNGAETDQAPTGDYSPPDGASQHDHLEVKRFPGETRPLCAPLPFRLPIRGVRGATPFSSYLAIIEVP